MLSPADRKKAADILIKAEKERVQAVQLSTTWPDITIEDSYAISTEVANRKIAAGAKLIGHKVGLTSKAMQRSSMIDEPDYGHLLDNMMIADGAKVPHENYCRPRVEIELAFIMGKRLAGPGVGLPEVLRATEYVVPAIEIVDARIRDQRKIFDTVADNGAAAGIVIGGRPVGPMDVDLRLVGGIMYRNSEIEETGLAAGVLGHPRSAWRGSPTSSALTRSNLNPATSCSQARSRASCSRKTAIPCTPILARSAASPCSSFSAREFQMDLPRNAFKHAIASGQLQIGLWCSLCSNITAEVVAHSGFDWLLLDTEHSPNELPDVLSQLQAVQTGTAAAIVRPAWNDMVLIKRYLDIGAQSLLIPFVQTAEEARAAVAATRYPPAGVRGITGSGRASRYGRVKDYLKNASREICVLVQVETKSALDQIENIASVEGVDGVFIGPNDLSASFGHIGNWGHAEVQAALKSAVQRLKKIDKPAGILTPNEEEAKRFIEWGYTFVAVGSDLGLLTRNADALAKKFKG